MSDLGLLPVTASEAERRVRYDEVRLAIASLLEGEGDWVAAMATVAAELHGAFEYFDWTGFYRLVSPDTLVIGPYQGGHGCLRIEVGRGVCGAAARSRHTQRVPDVAAHAGHIACSSSTRSEIVVPIIGPGGRLLGVLDVDSDELDAFRDADQSGLEEICAELGKRFEATPRL